MSVAVASLALTRRRALQQFSVRSLSSHFIQQPPQDPSSAVESGEPKQPFVQTRIRPGEWDPETRTNPLYRPKFRSQAKIWSMEDYEKQPTVGFSGEYESFQDAMVTLSWLTQGDQKQIYQLYCDIMEAAADKQRTSHEYVVRVIAQKFNLTAERVAGVIQLQHNEQQLIRRMQDGDTSISLLTEAADYMDNTIQQEIRDAYQAYGLKKPDEFVEDPVMNLGQERKTWQVVDDIFDVDQLMQDSIVREERRARLAIDNYIYVEDVDDATIEIPLSKDCRALLKAQAKYKAEVKPAAIQAPPSDGKRRDRWKYVAQVVNTRQLRRQQHNLKGKGKHMPKSYTNNHPENTLVEQDGELRAATQYDVQHTSWKAVRHIGEHTYKGAKQGWLDRKLRGNTSAWGKAPAAPPMAVKDSKPSFFAQKLHQEGLNESPADSDDVAAIEDESLIDEEALAQDDDIKDK